MPIRQITIIGTGLIGGSLGLALKKKKFAGRIVGCDREATIEKARMCGAIDAGTPNPGDSIHGSQIVVLATPVLAARMLASDSWQAILWPEKN
jgi:prephenate dehydrogenase